MVAKMKDFTKGSLTGISAKVTDDDFKRLIPKERFTSKEWLQKEYDLLWSRVWQWACREEEIPNNGDYYEYKIGDESIIIVRSETGKLNAFHNVCMHRGVRLVEGEHWWGGRGTLNNFRDMFKGKLRCVYHGWAWDLEGEISHLPGAKDFAPERIQKSEICLRPVRCETWEGFVFINMDMDAEPLLEYLEPGPEKLAKYKISEMRLKHHFTTILPTNWKYGVEQYQEGYHVWATHVMDLNDVGAFATLPGGRRAGAMFGEGKKGPGEAGYPEYGKPTIKETPPDPDAIGAVTVGEQFERHTNFWEPDKDIQTGVPKGVKLCDLKDEKITDPRTWVRTAMENMVMQGRLADYELDYFNGLSDDEIPWDMQGPEFMRKNRRDACTAQGIDISDLEETELYGFPTEFRFFPNMLGPIAGNTYGLFRSRPHGDNPNEAIWDVYFMFRYGEEEPPEVNYETVEWDNYPTDRMPRTFLQDWRITPLYQKGMHSRVLPGCRFNKQEANALHTHLMLDKIIGRDFEEVVED